MLRYLRIASVIRLIANGVTRASGWFLLILTPEGQLSGMSPDWLIETRLEKLSVAVFHDW